MKGITTLKLSTEFITILAFGLLLVGLFATMLVISTSQFHYLLNLVQANRTEVTAQVSDLRTELSTEIKDVRSEIKDVRTELSAEIKDVRNELSAEIKNVRTDLSAQIETLRVEVKTDIHNVRAEVTTLQRSVSDIDSRVAHIEGIMTTNPWVGPENTGDD